jgi:hypothetical protein
MYSHHEQYNGKVGASPDALFEMLDDQTRLSTHMTKRSWKMGWGKMDILLDEQRGKAVGSHIVLRGRVFGIGIYLDEVVTRRDPPLAKQWKTVGQPRLLVIGSYQMGFAIAPELTGARLTVVIDYDVPQTGISRILGLLFGRSYAKWCTRKMVQDAQRVFSPSQSAVTAGVTLGSK